MDPLVQSALASHPRDFRDPKITRSLVTTGTPIPRDYRNPSDLRDNKRDSMDPRTPRDSRDPRDPDPVTLGTPGIPAMLKNPVVHKELRNHRDKPSHDCDPWGDPQGSQGPQGC